LGRNHEIKSIEKEEMDQIQSPGRITFGTEVARVPGFAYSVEAPSNAGQDAIRGNMERTPLNQAYFSPANFQIIQNAIRRQVYEKHGALIDPVSTDDLYVVMRSMYYQYCRNLDTHIPEQIQELNDRVVTWCLPKIIAEIDMDKRYLKDITTMPVPLSHPVNLASAGTKSLPFKPFF
jgi:hypothetical protein